MVFRRNFTVMVVPDARGGLRRFHVKGKQLAIGAAVVVLLAVLALISPVALFWGHSKSVDLASAQDERDMLSARARETEETIRSLRQELDHFEKRTEALATLAGLELPQLGGQAQGLAAGTEGLDDAERAELSRTESDELLDRSALLGRRLDSVEQVIGEQSNKLAKVPSILPVHGLLGSGFAWRRHPFTGRRQFHRGLDIAAPQGTPIVAPADGIVVKTERNGGYGNVLYISHGNGIVTRYGHLLEYKTRPGQKVSRGEVIGLVGNTGRSTGPHLHYEVLLNGEQVNPQNYVLDGLF